MNIQVSWKMSFSRIIMENFLDNYCVSQAGLFICWNARFGVGSIMKCRTIHWKYCFFFFFKGKKKWRNAGLDTIDIFVSDSKSTEIIRNYIQWLQWTRIRDYLTQFTTVTVLPGLRFLHYWNVPYLCK